MKFKVAAAFLVLSACAEVLDETRTTAVLPNGYYKGETYDIVTRTIQGRNGPYKQTRVVYWGTSAPCILDSPTDCEKAARRLIDHRLTGGGF
jgi:hypothetical protein